MIKKNNFHIKYVVENNEIKIAVCGIKSDDVFDKLYELNKHAEKIKQKTIIDQIFFVDSDNTIYPYKIQLMEDDLKLVQL